MTGSSESTLSRVRDIKASLNVSAYVTNNVITIAVADVESPDGTKFRLVGVNTSITIEKDQKTYNALKSVPKPNEILVPGIIERGHAEQNIYEFVKKYGLTVTEIDPSRPFCKECSETRRQNSSKTSSKTSRKSFNKGKK